jgi:rubrerythrin
VTVQQDLQKAVASAEAAQGSYLSMSNATQDQTAKQMFQTMSDDVQRHIEQLKGRLNYVETNNPMNQQQN